MTDNKIQDLEENNHLTDTKEKDIIDDDIEIVAVQQPLSDKSNNSVGYLEWKDINFFVNTKKEGEKQILFDICGDLPPGSLLAIMGGSGAGKSSLLNCLSGRLINKNKVRKITGTVALNNKKFVLGSDDSIKAISAYVMQQDILSATDTPIEALKFSSKLRLHNQNLSDDEIMKIINKVLKELKIYSCKDTLIGNEQVNGLSGGQKKRTSVGVELVTDNNLIFLDEPTSGLDSFTAHRTLKILKELTNNGKQIIATLHQPSSQIFNLFDNLCLLSKGYVVYFGRADKAIDYFSSIGFDCPKYSNPADFLVDTIQENSDKFIYEWKEYSKNKNNKLNFDNYSILKPKSEISSSFIQQISQILSREFRILTRDPRPTKIRFGQTLIFSIIVGFLYFQLPHDQNGLRDRFGCIFFLTVNSSLAGLISTLTTFPEQRVLFERERNNNMYSTTSYVLSKSIVSIPEQMLFTLIYQLIVYWTVGFDSTFGELYLSLCLCVLSTSSIGLLIGIAANTVSEALAIMPVAFMPLLLWSNYLVSIKQIPIIIRWIQYINPFKYNVEVLNIIEFKGVKYRGQGFSSGDDYLKFIGVNTNDKLFDWYMLAVLFFAFRFAVWILLVIRNGL